MRPELTALLTLARDERLELVEALWESLAAEDEAWPAGDSKHAELHRRRENFRADPSSGRTWEEVKAQFRAQSQAREPHD